MQAIIVAEIDDARELREIDLDSPFLFDLPPYRARDVLTMLDVSAAAVLSVTVPVVHAPSQEEPAVLEDKATGGDMDGIKHP